MQPKDILKESSDVERGSAIMLSDCTKFDSQVLLSPTGFQNRNNFPDVIDTPINRKTIARDFKLELQKSNSLVPVKNLHFSSLTKSKSTAQQILASSTSRLSSPDLPKRRWSSSRKRKGFD